MQRLNLMTLGAIAIGFCGFIYDASTDYRRDVAERPAAAVERASVESPRETVVLAAYSPAGFGGHVIVD